MKMSHIGILVGEMAKAVEFYTKARKRHRVAKVVSTDSKRTI